MEHQHNSNISGIIAVWKPIGITSHDVVAAIRRTTGERTVGHAGTLDPLAEGVLVIGVGREATRTLATEVKKEKEYVGEVTFGMTSGTDDAEGEKQVCTVEHIPSDDAVKQALAQFIGVIEQVPPVYSALKVRGESAHYRVRRGEEVLLKPRTVEIKAIVLERYQWPTARIRVVTGPGVYIRALARDLGAALGVGGYLSALTRTRVGEFTHSQCAHVDY